MCTNKIHRDPPMLPFKQFEATMCYIAERPFSIWYQTSSANWNKNFTCPSGRWWITSASPAGKSTSPGLFDRTFFACWSHNHVLHNCQARKIYFWKCNNTLQHKKYWQAKTICKKLYQMHDTMLRKINFKCSPWLHFYLLSNSKWLKNIQIKYKH